MFQLKCQRSFGQGATATYTTDKDGKFDFTIRYPKIYIAQWLNVQIGASSEICVFYLHGQSLWFGLAICNNRL